MVNGVKKLGERVGVSQEVVKIVMNVSVCKRQGIEWVAEQLLASWEGLFSMTLIVIHCSDCGSYNVENVQSSCSIIRFDESVYFSFSWQEVTLVLCWFYRAAQILCMYCWVHFW